MLTNKEKKESEVFFQQIKNYSSDEFNSFLEERSEAKTKVKTDRRTAYNRLKQDYKITMVDSKLEIISRNYIIICYALER
jgi:hypothetical protein